MEEIQIELTNWEKHNPRKDVKRPSWFALSNRFLEDTEFFDFSPIELKAVLYIWCQASQKNSATITIKPLHAKRVCDIDHKYLRSAIEKLEILKHLKTRTRPVRERDVDVRNPYATDITDITDITDTQHPELPFGPRTLFNLWNEHAPPLPVARELSKDRIKKAKARLLEKPLSDYWREVITRIATSSFCLGGGNTGWKANFDWLLKPDTHIRVMEGKYDGKAPENQDGWGLDDEERARIIAGGFS